MLCNEWHSRWQLSIWILNTVDLLEFYFSEKRNSLKSVNSSFAVIYMKQFQRISDKNCFHSKRYDVEWCKELSNKLFWIFKTIQTLSLVFAQQFHLFFNMPNGIEAIICNGEVNDWSFKVFSEWNLKVSLTCVVLEAMDFWAIIPAFKNVDKFFRFG